MLGVGMARGFAFVRPSLRQRCNPVTDTKLPPLPTFAQRPPFYDRWKIPRRRFRGIPCRGGLGAKARPTRARRPRLESTGVLEMRILFPIAFWAATVALASGCSHPQPPQPPTMPQPSQQPPQPQTVPPPDPSQQPTRPPQY